MEPKKSRSGKVILKCRHYVNVCVVFCLAVIVMIIAMAIKFKFVAKLEYSNLAFVYIGAAVCLTLFMGCMLLYILFSRQTLILSRRTAYAIFAIMALSYILYIYLPAVTSTFVIPATLAAFLIAPISRRRDAFVGNIFLNIMGFSTLFVESFLGNNMLIEHVFAVFFFGIVAGSVLSYLVSSEARRVSFIVKGLVVGVVQYCLIVLLLYFTEVDRAAFLAYVPLALIGTFLPVVLGLVLQPLIELAFNLVTNSRLLELMNHTSPLIKRLMQSASGTFNHSLMVANFAEICALAIGENPYLARACAYYHDVGKIENPQYYKENQSGGTNPHDELLPEVSAEIIRSHTVFGLDLCKEYKIPSEISHVTIQHHGTLIIPIFFNKAQHLTDEEVDPYEYSYHGVKPVTKIAAIIMICDAAEAAIRSLNDPSAEEVEVLLGNLINSRILDGQFENCDISLRDLNTIKTAIYNAFGGQFHKRLVYPDGKSAK